MLERQIARLGRASTLDGILIATTTNATDDPVEGLSGRLGLPVFRGSEEDVLSRYAGAAAMADAEIVVRTTADCPLIDGAVVDSVVRALAADGSDYASNVAARTFPRGLDVEVLTRAALKRCAALARSRPAREHVTWFIHTEQPSLFKCSSVTSPVDASDLRWTVDTPEDLAMVRTIYAGLRLAERHLAYPEILSWVRARPELSRMNEAIEQKKP